MRTKAKILALSALMALFSARNGNAQIILPATEIDSTKPTLEQTIFSMPEYEKNKEEQLFEVHYGGDYPDTTKNTGTAVFTRFDFLDMSYVSLFISMPKQSGVFGWMSTKSFERHHRSSAISDSITVWSLGADEYTLPVGSTNLHQYWVEKTEGMFYAPGDSTALEGVISRGVLIKAEKDNPHDIAYSEDLMFNIVSRTIYGQKYRLTRFAALDKHKDMNHIQSVYSFVNESNKVVWMYIKTNNYRDFIAVSDDFYKILEEKKVVLKEKNDEFYRSFREFEKIFPK